MRAHDEPASRHIIPSIFTANSLFDLSFQPTFPTASLILILFLHLNAPTDIPNWFWHFSPCLIPHQTSLITTLLGTWWPQHHLHSFNFVAHIQNANRMRARWNPNLDTAASTPSAISYRTYSVPLPMPISSSSSVFYPRPLSVSLAVKSVLL